MREIKKMLNVGMTLISIGLVINFLKSPAECWNASMAIDILIVIGGFISIGYGMKRLEDEDYHDEMNGIYYIVTGFGMVMTGFLYVIFGC